MLSVINLIQLRTVGKFFFKEKILINTSILFIYHYNEARCATNKIQIIHFSIFFKSNLIVKF